MRNKLMAKSQQPSDWDSDSPGNSYSDEEEEEEEEDEAEEEGEKSSGSNSQEKQETTAYEKRRLERIAANKGKLLALGISKVASSFTASATCKTVKASKQRKGKLKVAEDDEDYKPNNNDFEDDDDDDEDHEDDFDDEDESLASESGVKSRGKKAKKNIIPKPKKKARVQNHSNNSAYIDNDDDDALMQAIALSLQDSGEASNVMQQTWPVVRNSVAKGPDSTISERKGNFSNEKDTKKKKNKPFSSRVMMTEDELILHFFQFDEVGNGTIGIRDLRRLAAAHDFTWSDDELAFMISCFDGDRDGKLNVDDFRKIASRCNMLEESKDS